MKAPSMIAVNGVQYLFDSVGSQLRKADDPLKIIPLPRLKMQEVPYDAPGSDYRFQPSVRKPLVVTPAAGDTYGPVVICGCLSILQQLVEKHDGLDYIQVFEDLSGTKSEPLWFIEAGDGGAITALLPSDY